MIVGAETIVFLGFSFWPINMKLLSSDAAGRDKSVVATVYGLSQPKIDAAENAIRHALGSNGQTSLDIKLENATAFNLMNDYMTMLSP